MGIGKTSKSSRGLFLTFEGTEGAGKSTLIRILEERLRARGAQVISTREPGGTPLAEGIRQLILDQQMSPVTELLLYEAARAEHVEKIILPALKDGKIILCDRFTDSSLAYQSAARGLSWTDVTRLNTFAAFGLKPDLTIWVDIDPKIGLERAAVKTRFEEEGLEFQKKVRKGFLKARSQNPKRWLTLRPGQKSPEQLAEAVLKVVSKKYANYTNRTH